MSMTEEPYIWLQEGEAKGADATGLVELFADWFSRGPAVFLDPKVMHAVNMHADLVELVYDYQSSSTMTPESHFAELRARAWKLLEKARGKDEPHRCTGCGRIEIDCSRDPCAAVLEDRARYASGTGN